MSSHILSTRVYFAIFFALMVLTALTIAVAYVNLGAMNNVVAVAIACTKAALVILYFMHVRYSDRLIQLSVEIGNMFVLILIAFTVVDPLTRTWVRPLQYIQKRSGRLGGGGSGATTLRSLVARTAPLPDHVHGACLGTLVSLLLGEAHRAAHLETLKVAVDDAVSVKVDLAPVAGGDESVSFRRGDLAHARDLGARVCLHEPLPLAIPRLDLTLRGVEGIPYRHVDIFVRVVLRRLTIHDDLVPRHRQIDTHVKQRTLMLVAMRRLDHDPTAHDMLVKTVEPFGPLAHPLFHGGGGLHPSESDLQR